MVDESLTICDLMGRSIHSGSTRPLSNDCFPELKDIIMSTKATYERPTVKKVGSIEAITKSTQTGDITDATFPASTPLSQLTLS